MTVSIDSSGNNCTITELQGHGPNQIQYVGATCPQYRGVPWHVNSGLKGEGICTMGLGVDHLEAGSLSTR